MNRKHKWYRIFIGFLAIFCLFSNASSAFVMDGGDEFNNGELQNKDTDEENCVTFDYNDQQTLSYKYYIGNSGEKLDTSVVESLKPDTTGTSHTFIGWSTTRTGLTSDGTGAIVDFSSTTFYGGETLYAKYHASGDYTFKATQDADMSIKPSSSSTQSKVYLSPSSDSISGEEMKITSAIGVYYDTSMTAYSTSTVGSDETVKHPSEANVLLVLDTDLVIDGGSLQLNSIVCTTGKTFCNQISGSFTALDLNGYNIYIRNDGKLLGYGLIYNSRDTGGIIVEKGELRTILTPTDFKGGGQTVSRFCNVTLEFTAFLLPYLCCETICSNESIVTADCSLYASGAKYSTTVAYILGKYASQSSNYSQGVFEITKGYMIRRTTPYMDLMESANQKGSASSANQLYLLDSNYREYYFFVDDPVDYVESIDTSRTAFYSFNRAEIGFGNLTLTMSVTLVGTVSVSFADNEFPMASNFSLHIYNCDFGIAMPVIFMPGSYCYVDKNSTFSFGYQSSGQTSCYIYARLSFLDRYPGLNTASDADVRLISGTSTKVLSTGLNGYVVSSFNEPARMDMEGKFVFDTSASVLSSSYYEFYSIGGYINCSDAAIQSLKENSGCVQLTAYYAFPGYYEGSSSSYCNGAMYYYNQPVISGDRVFFQTESLGTVYEGTVVEDTPYVYYYNGDYYFFVYSDNSKFYFTSTTSTGPNPIRMKAHFQNFKGNFTKASSLTYLTDNGGNTTYYVTYNSAYYVPLGGLMLPASTQPSVTNGVFSTCTVSSSNKFTLSETYSDTSYAIGTSLEYNYYTGRWRFATS